MNSSRDIFVRRLAQLNITLSDEQLGQFDDYYHILVEQNRYMNLTAITEYEDVLLKHYVDCLAVNVVPCFNKLLYEKNVRVIDVGTGAGFPGIPLKIAFPDLQIDLLDSLNKRIHFLSQVIDSLNLKGINAYHGRAEDFANNINYREKYDLCVSRAVANLTTLSEYCLPFIKKDGLFIALKSGEINKELISSQNAIDILGGSVLEVIPFTLPESDIERSFVVIRKIKNTPKKYPRKAGLPSKEPLI